MAQLNPYLNFNRNCRDAMNFYKECLGGTLTMQTVGEMPAIAAQTPPEYSEQIMHSSLVTEGITIFASDMNREKPNEGNTYQLCLNCNSDEEIDSLFSKLSAGGKVIEPLADMPWGGKYGAIIDKFGKSWLFNYQKIPMM
jgi:PhnB protein